MTPDERVERTKAYVVKRLREELQSGPRGAAAQLARKFGMSTAHISNVLSASAARGPGEAFRRQAAQHWGLSPADLERIACGEEAPDEEAIRRVVRAEVAAIREEVALNDRTRKAR